MRNYYEILEIPETASQQLIELAYKTLSQKYNSNIQSPEKIKSAKLELEQIEEAYHVLSNPTSRAQYNLRIGIGSDILKQYNNLYEENQQLKEEVNTLKSDDSNKSKGHFKKRKFKGIRNNSVLKELPSVKEVFKTLGTVFYNETKKPKQERSKDLTALIITIIIIGVIIFLLIKNPSISKFLFPELN